MRWSWDASRLDEGRFVCGGSRNHKESLRENTIFDELRVPLALSFRLIFKDFVEMVPAAVAAFLYDIDPRTVAEHYNFARRCIKDHMEEIWEA
jgi:hypothetical protein